jgi:hypothetical protein
MDQPANPVNSGALSPLVETQIAPADAPSWMGRWQTVSRIGRGRQDGAPGRGVAGTCRWCRVPRRGEPSGVLAGIGEEPIPMRVDTAMDDPIVTPKELRSKPTEGGEFDLFREALLFVGLPSPCPRPIPAVRDTVPPVRPSLPVSWPGAPFHTYDLRSSLLRMWFYCRAAPTGAAKGSSAPSSLTTPVSSCLDHGFEVLRFGVIEDRPVLQHEPAVGSARV